MHLFRAFALAMLVAIPSHAQAEPDVEAEEREAFAPVDRVGLFKNGLAVIARTLDATEHGVYRLSDVPEPAHGTWFVQGPPGVRSRVVMRDLPGGADLPVEDPSRDLVGRTVAFHLRGDGRSITGTVVALRRMNTWDHAFDRRGSRRYDRWGDPVTPLDKYIAVDHERGRSYVDPDQVAFFEVQGREDAGRRQAPVLLIDVPGPQDGSEESAKPVRITYLTRGLAWAPSYQVDLTDERELRVRQVATIRNELEDLADAEWELISGFPSMAFSHVLSPMAPGTTWSEFFYSLSQKHDPGNPAALNIARQESGGGSLFGDARKDESSGLPAERSDLHYQPIGKLALREGDSATLDVVEGAAPYDRVTQWIVPDTRNEYGRHYDEDDRRQEPDRFDDAPWDAVRFRNPLGIPMTTGPATTMAGGRFLGQQLSEWTNRDEEMTLKVTKALAIRTNHSESETEERESYMIGGYRYAEAVVGGELRLHNHRDRPATMIVKRRFSGELAQASDNAAHRLLEQGVYSLNARNELTWNFELAPGEEKTLTYSYTVLVRR